MDIVFTNATTTPVTRQGRDRRAKRDALSELTGMAFCTSCQRTRPKDQVKVYRSQNPKQWKKGGVIRCDACQARRVEWLKSRTT